MTVSDEELQSLHELLSDLPCEEYPGQAEIER
jgi:hypothetical protein